MSVQSPSELPSLTNEVRRLLDRVEIEDVIKRYGRGLEINDADMVASCFAEDGMIDLGYVKLEGRKAIRDFYAARSQPGAKIAGSPIRMERRVSTPYNANVAIELHGDHAHSESSCLAIHAGTKNGAEVVLMRGTHNSDELVRTAAGWKIKQRIHTTQWATEHPGVPSGH